MLEQLNWIVFEALVVHWAVIIGLSARVIMRRRPVGVSLAWIAIIFSVPYLGAIVYLVIGENRISSRYAKRAAAIHDRYTNCQRLLGDYQNGAGRQLEAQKGTIRHLAESVAGFTVLPGNRLNLLLHYEVIFRSLISDIDRSTRSCHLEFYIWHPGGLADALGEALVRAAQRGVICRVLVDAVGSKEFLGSGLASRMRKAGVTVADALPAGITTMFFSRADLRNHRKVAVIDGEIAYTGSQNLVDPRYFKQDVGVGQWVDAMARMEGPGAAALALTFAADWEVVTGEILEPCSSRPSVEHGNVNLQLVPSGPAPEPLAILKLLLAVIYHARHELVVTTPYFVPDDSLFTALATAAQRGVRVTLIIPAKNDSWLVDHASRSFFDDLLGADVRIAAFHGGLLHTKSITVDEELCVFGSVNFDMRSLWLNFEMSLLVYDREFTRSVRAMQDGYLTQATFVDRDSWQQRPLTHKFLENTVRLAAPLL